jgi:hypothetical protein
MRFNPIKTPGLFRERNHTGPPKFWDQPIAFWDAGQWPSSHDEPKGGLRNVFPLVAGFQRCLTLRYLSADEGIADEASPHSLFSD